MSNKIKINDQEFELEFSIKTIRQFGRKNKIKSLSKTAGFVGKAFEGIDDFDNMDIVSGFVKTAIDDKNPDNNITQDNIIDNLYNQENITVVANAITEAFQMEADKTKGKPTRAEKRKQERGQKK